MFQAGLLAQQQDVGRIGMELFHSDPANSQST